MTYTLIVVSVASLYLLSHYMYRQLQVMIDLKKQNKYSPNIKKSVIELTIFITIFAVNTTLAILPDFSVIKFVSITLLLFLFSVGVMNQMFLYVIGEYTKLVFTVTATVILFLIHLEALGVLS